MPKKKNRRPSIKLPSLRLLAGIVIGVVVLVGGGYLLLPFLRRVPPGITGVELSYTIQSAPTLLTAMGPDATGIHFVNTLSLENQVKYTYNGAGVATGDFDGDGLADIFLVSEETPSRLYRNLGNFQFEDATEQAGLQSTTAPGGFGIGAYFADIDEDGDLDLFVTNWKVSNRLFRNNGNGTFTDITEKAGVTYAGGATTATFADYDRDGDLDFFVATYRPTPIENENANIQLQVVNGQVVVPQELQDRLMILKVSEGGGQLRELGERDLLYRNNGDGTFTEVAAQAGIQGGYWGLSAIFADVDNDNWPDLYVTNDLWSPDTFYRNLGNGQFQLMAPAMLQNTPWYSMGIDFADINNDGLNDYFIGDMVSRDHTKRLTQHGGMDMSPPPPGTTPQIMRNSLYLNNGDGSFSDIAWLAHVALSDWTWSSKFADLDLDGYLDLLITNGMVRDLMDSDAFAQGQQIAQTQGREAFMAFLHQYPTLNDANVVFRNKGDLTFEDVSAQWGFNTAGVGHGAALADLDNDGDLDIVVNYMNQPASIYQNHSVHQRLTILLHGQASNRFGIGARLTLATDQGTQTRLMTTSGGYLSSHQPIVVFGLGDGMQIQSLTVEWPSGHVQVFSEEDGAPLQPNRQYTIAEPAEKRDVPPARLLQPNASWFVELSREAGLTWAHVENPFDDFATQKLLPRGLSQLGPGLVWADMNGDGYDDLYLAGAAGQSGVLYQNNGNATFREVTGLINWQTSPEKMAGLWLHLGNTPELLLSYGSIENPNLPVGGRYLSTPGNPFALQSIAWQELSPASSGALAASDFDIDGDLDVFVGGRVIPNRWPLPAPSRLYANQGGQLTDVTATLAPELQNLGLATGALWLDVDNDGDSDLLVATEWGPVRLFKNDQGQLSDQTVAAGLHQWTGLWTGITAGDYDHDNDMDFAVANLGLNTKYAASPEFPLTLFAGDVNGTGNVNIIETVWVDGVLRPLKERGMAGADMPFILEKFPTFLSFAMATLDEIYGDKLAQLQRFEANTLTHTLFLNNGSGRFTAHPLPHLTQITAGYGLATADFDNDGHDDLYLVGNFSYADHETMMYTGGISYWMRGHGDGTFSVVPSGESGLLVPYEARGVGISDFNNDGWADIAVALNNHTPLLFRNLGRNNAHCSIQVRLSGPPGNPTGVGARVTVSLPDGITIAREVLAGGGYLSQDSATLLFGVGTASQAAVSVRWPDGTTSPPVMTPACQPVHITR